MPSTPEVSVVVPTFARPALVTRAVRSALAQTVTDIQVVVVVDGPDENTGRALAAIGDPRLRVVELPAKGGAPNARNVGVREARAFWTALLDDDDEWLPNKLAVQLELARSASMPSPVVASRLINKTPRAEFVMPRRLPEPGEPVCEYLTRRRGLFHGDGFIQTSTILAPTELLRRVPFTVGLRRQQELDWTVRASSQPDVGLLIAAEPLVLWHQDENRPRISLSSPWQAQLDWLRGIRPLITPRAYAAIIMSIISSMAAPTRSFRVFWLLLTEARRNGRPGAWDYLTFVQIWLIPPQVRHRIRDRILGGRRAADHHDRSGQAGSPTGGEPVPGAAGRPMAVPTKTGADVRR
ncbi:glycosyltransferase family 2 protein [Micromonospora zingiberis]|uniref:Glycosyltransferase family 2 protein n=1 Tax=Micromonospora zingiberis TaxID=2053011 RepID=A0A4R0GQG3_9ACTN|nr:glycosyltransferase family 2 protein [Micromonospora zingiberis]TCB99012.1 glycosyltransferase family 2 protein [Micromonospora zingiberis]